MVREIIVISIGQCGIQLGHSIWEQYCAEHNINNCGELSGDSKDTSFQSFFEETEAKQFVPRSLMVDLEPNVIDDIKNSSYSKLYPNMSLLNSVEDAANIFARGHYTLGRHMIDRFNDRMRKLYDSCDNCQGFMINHAVGGGTGSGFGSLILERLAVDYRKKCKVKYRKH